MKPSLAIALAAAVAAVPLCSFANDPGAPPAEAPRRGMRGMKGPGQRLYDPKTVGTFTGEVVAVEKRDGRRGQGIHLSLKTADGTLAVHVGPTWFLEKNELALGVGDQVEVTGSRVTFAGGPAVIAQVVKKGNIALALRDIGGVPVWAGRGGGR